MTELTNFECTKSRAPKQTDTSAPGRIRNETEFLKIAPRLKHQKRSKKKRRKGLKNKTRILYRHYSVIHKNMLIVERRLRRMERSQVCAKTADDEQN